MAYLRFKTIAVHAYKVIIHASLVRSSKCNDIGRFIYKRIHQSIKHHRKSFDTFIYKSFLQNTISRNASEYTVNKQTYIHSLYINTKTYQQINVLHYKYNHISTKQLHVYTKRKCEGHITQNKVFFLISKDFIMNIDKFLISILFSVFISSINLGIFNLFQ